MIECDYIHIENGYICKCSNRKQHITGQQCSYFTFHRPEDRALWSRAGVETNIWCYVYSIDSSVRFQTIICPVGQAERKLDLPWSSLTARQGQVGKS